MTTYSHTITLTDSERVALQAALHFMIRHCDRYPSWERDECRAILMKPGSSTPVMTSK